MRLQGKLLSTGGREVATENHRHGRPQMVPVSVGRHQTVIDEFLEIQLAWELKTPSSKLQGDTHTFMSFISSSPTRFLLFPVFLAEGGRKWPFWNMLSVFLNRAYCQGKLFYQNLLTGVLPKTNQSGGREIPNSSLTDWLRPNNGVWTASPSLELTPHQQSFCIVTGDYSAKYYRVQTLSGVPRKTWRQRNRHTHKKRYWRKY